jgi:hypothetical protein
MKKEILLEINRINELMGVEKKLLTESNIIGKMSEIFKDFLNKEAKPYANTLDKFIIGSQVVDKKVLNNILDVCDDPSLFNGLSAVEKNVFASLLGNSEKVVNSVYDDLIKNLMTVNGQSEEALIKFISEQRTGGKTVREILTDMFGGDEFAANVLSSKITKKVSDYYKGNFTPEIVKTVVNPKRFRKPITQISELSDEYVNKLMKAYGGGWFRAFERFKLTILDMMTSEEKKIDEILSLIKTSKTITDDPEQYVALTKRLSDLFLDLTKTKKENFIYITKWIDNNDSKKILDNLIKTEETLGLEGYQKALRIANKKAYDELQMGWKKLRQRRSEALDQLLTFINPANWFGKRLIDRYGDNGSFLGLQITNIGKQWQDLLGFYKTNKGDTKEISTRFERLRRELYFGSTKTSKEYKDVINNLGYKAYVPDRLMEYAYSIVVSTLVLSVLDFIREVLASTMFQYWDYANKNWEWVSEQAKQWDEKRDNNIASLNTESSKKLARTLNNLTGEKASAILGLIGLIHSGFQSVFSNFTGENSIPGWADDLTFFLGIDWFKLLQSKDGIKETVDEIETRTDTIRNQVVSDTNSIIQGEIPDWAKNDSTTTNQSQPNDSAPVKPDTIPGETAPDTLKNRTIPGL